MKTERIELNAADIMARNNIRSILAMIEGIKDSVDSYTQRESKIYGPREHSKTSIQRRITVAREELLKLSKLL